jgi:hypothetical protein
MISLAWPFTALVFLALAFKAFTDWRLDRKANVEHLAKLAALETRLADLEEKLKSEGSFAAVSAAFKNGRR